MSRVPEKDTVKPITHDISQDWSHYRRFGKVRFGALKFDDFMLPLQGINDQAQSEFCTGYTVSEAIGIQVGIPMSPEWQTAQIGKVSGAPIFNGADPKMALKSGTISALPKDKSPVTFEKDGWTTPAIWGTWPTFLDAIAAQYKRAGWYNVLFGGPDDFDAFDMSCLALNDAKSDNAPIMAFAYWYAEWNDAALGTRSFQNPDGSWTLEVNPAGKTGIMPVPTRPPQSRHAYLSAVGLKTINGIQHIIAQLSQGEEYGDSGLLYFSRETWNYAWKNPVQNQIGMYIYRSKNPPFLNMVLEFIGNVWRYVAR